VQWRSRTHNRNVERLQKRRLDDIKERVGRNWNMKHRIKQRIQGEAYVQEWMRRDC